MTRPLFTVVVPTLGRPTLARTLESIRSQSVPAEIIVVADTFEMADATRQFIDDVVREYGADGFEVNAFCHVTGSPQLARGYDRASSHWLADAPSWVMNLGDDDVYVDGAFEAIKAAIDEIDGFYPLMFKAELHPAPQRGNTRPVVLWEWPRIERFNVTGQCFVAPTLVQNLGFWYDDVSFMQATVNKWGGRIAWREELICRCY